MEGWRKSRKWLHDMVHYMPKDQIEFIIDELVEHGDVTRKKAKSAKQSRCMKVEEE